MQKITAKSATENNENIIKTTLVDWSVFLHWATQKMAHFILIKIITFFNLQWKGQNFKWFVLSNFNLFYFFVLNSLVLLKSVRKICARVHWYGRLLLAKTYYPLNPCLVIMYMYMTLKSQMSICAAKPDLEDIHGSQKCCIGKIKKGMYVVLYCTWSYTGYINLINWLLRETHHINISI